MNSNPWLRVSKQNPCKICEKPDWCCYTEDETYCCMRVQSNLTAKNGGYIHKLKGVRLPILKQRKMEVKRDEIDCFSIWNSWKNQTTPKSLILFAEKLGVDPMALHSLGCIWAYPHTAWAFPMRNAKSEMIGIRLRNEVGHKWAVTGSRSGLFIPNSLDPKEILLICEGPTDTAAALCMGFQAIGRPSCIGLEEMIKEFIKINSIKRVVIVADNDEPGINGAGKLQCVLNVISCILILPCKDMREFYLNGGTKTVIESILKNLIWTKK